MLGLSFLHLLTGHEPYEVLLADVRCPLFLCKELRELWTPDDPEDQYFLIRQVVRSLDFGDAEVDDRGDYDGLLLCDTLYRFLVMFGTKGLPLPPSAQQVEDGEADLGLSACASSRAWRIVCEALGLDNRAAPVVGANAAARERERERDQCARQFQRDCSQWSFASGSNPVMRRAREALEEMGSCALLLSAGVESVLGQRSRGYSDMDDALARPLDLLARMVHLDPTKR
jgi:hypothetical protein